MFWLVLIAHMLGITAAAVVGRPVGGRPAAEQQRMRPALAVAALAPAGTTAWIIGRLISQSDPWIGEILWVDGLDLGLRFQLDAVSSMMALLVSGVGALVLVYAIGYFEPNAAGATRFPASMLAFSTSMLGLVVADSIWTLFIFWEFTSITSFLLVGHKNEKAEVRTAARRALLITGGGGLVLLAGLIVLADTAGTTSLSELAPIDGTSATVAAILIMIGAATKSAQIPFHVWLPGAMAAPTPVSAYLHSATMVKAGVLLIAVTGSAFADVAAWSVLGGIFGVGSMIWGAVGALRHRDAKLILAWGTVSQLGLLVTLLSIGTGKAVFAATSILFAHALFKAALFAVVGEIDIRTGTRDIDELGGLWRSMPIATGTAVLAGLSMAGVPPLLGFAAKEAAIEAVLGLEGLEQTIMLPAVVIGSTLTVAYTARFLITVFGSGPATVVASRRWAMTIPSAILGLAGLVGFAAMGVVNDIVLPAATELNEKSSVYLLLQWPGFKTAFVVSMAVVGVGGLAGFALARRQTGPMPRPVGADAADASIDGVLSFAPRLIGRIQHGSLPVYLVTMAIAMIVASVFLVGDFSTDHLVAWDRPVQALLALLITASAISGAFVNSRFGAAFTLGAVGVGMGGIFVAHGAPDLALTQLLVETVVVVGFVLGLGHLAQRFPDTDASWRMVRLAVSIVGGLAVMAALAAAGANPSGRAPIEALSAQAVDEGGGKNVVNVVLTDVRALDTLGEVVVLVVVAVGVLALATSSSPSGTKRDAA